MSEYCVLWLTLLSLPSEVSSSDHVLYFRPNSSASEWVNKKSRVSEGSHQDGSSLFNAACSSLDVFSTWKSVTVLTWASPLKFSFREYLWSPWSANCVVSPFEAPTELCVSAGVSISVAFSLLWRVVFSFSIEMDELGRESAEILS